MVKKMKALEADMGLYDDYYNEENETPMGSEGTESEGSSDSESHSSSPSPTKRKDKKRKRDREERHAKRKRRRHERHRVEGKDEVCGLYMQGKCPKVKIYFNHKKKQFVLKLSICRQPRSAFILMMLSHLRYGSCASSTCLTGVPRETSAFTFTRASPANTSIQADSVRTLQKPASLVMNHSMTPQGLSC